jgi:DNA-binding transcriptional ArsR family regulator
MKRTRPREPATPLAQIKALADPVRYQVYEHLVAAARSPKQMAEILGTPPTRLYHHFAVLERAGLIARAGTRRTRGTVEQYFTAAVDRLDAAGRAKGRATVLLPAIYAGVLQSTLAELDAAARPGRTRARGAHYLKRYRLKTTPARAEAIRARLEAVAEACEQAAADPGDVDLGITLACAAPAPRAPRGPR